jgi:hypothetical protein
MSKRRVQLVILCEDRQHSAFARRFAEASGWERRKIQVIHGPKARGSGEQWVREQYVGEVRKLRAAPHVARALVILVDEDKQGAGLRETKLAEALQQADLSPRGVTEGILHVVPARNIETWLAYLRGEDVNEHQSYPKLAQERDCRPMVGEIQLSKRDALDSMAPRGRMLFNFAEWQDFCCAVSAWSPKA